MCLLPINSASGRAGLPMTNPDEHVILPETISNEPISPMVPHGDQVWRDIVVWTLNALISAEEYGVTSKNIDKMANDAKNPFVQRLLGKTGKFGGKIGLGPQWAYRAIKSVGNYGGNLGEPSRQTRPRYGAWQERALHEWRPSNRPAVPVGRLYRHTYDTAGCPR